MFSSISKFPLFKLREKFLLPIVQGGMGVGVSAHRLAGNVAALGAVGTIASIDLRRLHPDLMAVTDRSRDRALIEAANITALEREIHDAKKIANGNGAIAVNIMRAVTQYPDYVKTAGEAGADAIVMGAGLPLDLPDITADYPKLSLIPILSDVRGVALLLKKWMRKNRLPNAIVIEHPRYAGGHLGAAKSQEINDPRFNFDVVVPGVLQTFEDLGIAEERIPVIVAGGISSHENLRDAIDMGASAVQIGTAFAVTEEGDAHPTFKKVLAEAEPKDVVTFMSAAGLPARAVLTPWLDKYLRREAKLQAAASPDHRCTLAWDCLLSCGLRDGIATGGQFCIDHQLAAAVRGDYEKGLFFRGAGDLPFGKAIRPVKELIEYLLTNKMPTLLEARAA